MPASTTVWICSLVPAVMLEMVQHASFLMLFLWLVVSRFSRQGSAPQLMMICGRVGASVCAGVSATAQEHHVDAANHRQLLPSSVS
jgi:hypothetical protein